MKIKVINAIFATTVRLPDKSDQTFVTSEGIDNKRRCELTYDTDSQLLEVIQPGHNIGKLVGVTNIKDMSFERETAGIDEGVKPEAPVKAKLPRSKVS